jgi:hypothetical protein
VGSAPKCVLYLVNHKHSCYKMIERTRNYLDNVMFYFFSVSFPGLSVQPVLAPPRGPGDRLSDSEARPELGRRESPVCERRVT